MTASISDIIAAMSGGIAILALFVSLYASFISRRVATSDFQAVEKVKLDTARLIAVLRALMVKGNLYTKEDKEKRDDPNYEFYISIAPEQQGILEFMHSSTALAYYSFVTKKSKIARDAGKKDEKWRAFFLELGQFQQIKNPWSAAKLAVQIELQFDGIGEKEFREIAYNLNNIPKAIESFYSETLERKHDVLTYGLVEGDVARGPISEDEFIDFVKFLREVKKIYDPDLDTFWAASSGDVQLLKSALKKGANINITSGAVMQRYQNLIEEFKKYSAELDETQ